MKNFKPFLLALLLSIILTACSEAAIPERFIPTPKPGNSTIAGVLVSSKDGTPYSNTYVRLAEVYRKDKAAAFVLDAAFSPGALTNEKGEFIISDIKPGEYVIIIGDPAVNYLIIEDNQTGDAKVWNAPESGILDVGIFKIDF